MSEYPGPGGRKRAIALNAVDARTLLRPVLPIVLQHMTAAQIGQVQKVLDATVVNPAVQKEYQELMRKSIIAQSGAYANRDPRIVAQANKVFQEQIPISESDKRIRLDYAKLLAPDALKSRTDNPDEAAFLRKISVTLMSKGVWLRIGQPFVRSPEGGGQWMIDPRSFQVWLSLGPDGDTIPTQNGSLTREALLGTTVLGANYYLEVYQGTTQKALKKALSRVEVEISDGLSQHFDWDRHRNRAAPGVVPVSDALGGAKYPSPKIWDVPHKLLVQALEQNVGGNIKDSSQTALYAAVAAESCARLLQQYIDATTKGAERAVKVLSVLKTVGQIAEYFLVVRALVGGLVRLMAVEAAETTTARKVTTEVAKDRSPAAHYPTNYQSPPHARYRPEFEKTVDIVNRTPVSGEFGSAINRYDLATRQTINAWHGEFEKQVKNLMIKKGDTAGGWVVSREEFVALDKAVSAKYGDIFALHP